MSEITEEKAADRRQAGSSNGKTLDLPALENRLWDAACTIRGPIDAPKYENYILPLIFLKRLSDVFDKQGERYEFKEARRPPESSSPETRIAQIFADGVH